MPIPNLVNLSPELTEFLGGFAGIFAAFFNVIAIATVLWFLFLLGKLAVAAFGRLNNRVEPAAEFQAGSWGEANRWEVVRDVALNLVELVALALVVFLIVTNGPNVIYGLATGALGLVNPTTSDVSGYAGPFAGLFSWIQNGLALVIVLVGTAYLLWRAFRTFTDAGYIDYTNNATDGATTNDSTLVRVRAAIDDIWVTTLLIVLLFIAVRYGPQLLFDLLNNSTSVIG